MRDYNPIKKSKIIDSTGLQAASDLPQPNHLETGLEALSPAIKKVLEGRLKAEFIKLVRK